MLDAIIIVIELALQAVRDQAQKHLGFYVCPGVPEDTGGCDQMLTSLGTPCDRPDWAEYPDEH